MKKALLLLAQVLLVLVAIATAVFLLWEPLLEGRNAQATVFAVYFHDPFLAAVYVLSVLYFRGLYHAYQLLRYVRRGDLSSVTARRSIRLIRGSALVLVAAVVGAEAYLLLVVRGTDDVAGGVMMGLVLMIVFTLVAVGALYFERRLVSS